MSLKQNLKQKRSLVLVIGTVALLVIWLALVNPTNGSPILLLLPFVLIFILLYKIIGWAILGSSSGSRLGRRRKAVVWLVSSFLEVLLVMSSLGQLGIGDLITIIVIATIGLFYIFKLVPDKSE